VHIVPVLQLELFNSLIIYASLVMLAIWLLVTKVSLKFLHRFSKVLNNEMLSSEEDLIRFF